MDVGAPETSGTRVVSCWTGRLYMWLEKASLLDLEYHGPGVNKRVHLIGTKALLVARIRAIPVIQAVVTVKGEIPLQVLGGSYDSLYESLCESQ